MVADLDMTIRVRLDGHQAVAEGLRRLAGQAGEFRQAAAGSFDPLPAGAGRAGEAVGRLGGVLEGVDRQVLELGRVARGAGAETSGAFELLPPPAQRAGQAFAQAGANAQEFGRDASRAGNGAAQALDALPPPAGRARDAFSGLSGQLKRYESSLETVRAQGGQAFTAPAAGADRLRATLLGLGGVLAGAFVIDRVMAFGAEILRATAAIEALETRLKFMTGSGTQAAQAMDYLWKTSGALHTPIDALASSYSRLQPLVQENLMTTAQLRQAVEGFSQAGAATGASTEDLKLAMIGFAQAMGRGKVAAEELNQMAEPMPGLLNKIGRAAGTTAGGFREMAAEGNVSSEQFLGYVLKALEEYRGAAAASAVTLQAQFTAIGNAWEHLLVTLGQPIKDPFAALLGYGAYALDQARKMAGGATLQEQITEAQVEVKRRQVAVEQTEQGWNPLKGLSLLFMRSGVADAQGKLDDLLERQRENQRGEAFHTLTEQRTQAAVAAKTAATAARADADKLAAKLDKDVAKHEDAAAKIARIWAKAAADKAVWKGMAGKDIKDTEIAQAMEKIQTVAQAEVAAVEATERKKALIRRRGGSGGPESGAWQRLKGYAKTNARITDLASDAKISGLPDRDRAIAQEVARAVATAAKDGVTLSQRQRDQLAAGAATVFDQTQARKGREKAGPAYRRPGSGAFQSLMGYAATEARIKDVSRDADTAGKSKRERAISQEIDRAETDAAKRGQVLSDRQRQALTQATGRLWDQTEARKAATKAERDGARESEKGEKALKALNRSIDEQLLGLRAEQQALGLTGKERAIAVEVQRAESEARRRSLELTPTQIAAIKAEAGALHDLTEARQRLPDGRQLKEAQWTPHERRDDTARQYKMLLEMGPDRGGIDTTTYERAMKKLEADTLHASKSWQDGLVRGFRQFGKAAEDGAAVAEDAVSTAFKGMEDALAGMITGTKMSWGGMVDSMVADLARLTIRQTVTGPLAGAASTFLSGLFGGGGGGGAATAAAGGTSGVGAIGPGTGYIYHAGGVVGAGGVPTRSLPWETWINAPRYHRGGVIGLAPDERPAILQTGEVVVPRGGAVGGGQGSAASSPPIKIEIIDQRSSGAPVRSEETQSADGMRVIRMIIADEVSQGIKNGRYDRPFGDAYGVKRRGF